MQDAPFPDTPQRVAVISVESSMKGRLLESVSSKRATVVAHARREGEPLASAMLRSDGVWPGRLAGTTGRLLHSAGFGVFCDQAVVSLTSFLASILVGRVCGKEDLGAFSLAVSLFWLAAGIPNALVWTPYVSRSSRLNSERRRLFRGSVTTHLIALAGILSCLFFLSAWIPWPGLADNSWFVPLFVALAPFTMMMLLREHLRRVHLAHIDAGQLLALDVPVAILQIVLVGALAAWGKLTATTAILSLALGCAPLFYQLLKYRHEYPLANARVRMHWAYNFNFGRWLLVMSVAWLLGDAAFRWLVLLLHGTGELGKFAAAFTMVLLVNPIVLTVQNLARSYAARELASGGTSRLLQWTWRYGVLLAVVALLLLGAIASFGGPLVAWMYGPDFTGLGIVVAALCLGMFFQVLTIPGEAALSALQDGKAILLASVARLAVILAAGIPLIMVYFSTGVGLTLAISSLVMVLFQWHFLGKRCRYGT